MINNPPVTPEDRVSSVNKDKNNILDDFDSFCHDTCSDFSFNKLRHLPHITQTSKLIEKFNLSHNLLTNVSSDIKEYRLLTHLDLSFNKIYSLPTAIFELVHLKFLNVSNNFIVFLPSEICRLSCLEELDVHLNQLKHFPDKVCELSSLRALLASNNHITTLPAGIDKLTRLRILDLRGNRLCRLPFCLRHLKWLETLHIDDNPLIHPPLTIAVRGLPHILTFLFWASKAQSIELITTSSSTNNKDETLVHSIDDSKTIIQSDTIPGFMNACMKFDTYNTASSIKFDDNLNTVQSNKYYSSKVTQCDLYSPKFGRHVTTTTANTTTATATIAATSADLTGIDTSLTMGRNVITNPNQVSQICNEQGKLNKVSVTSTLSPHTAGQFVQANEPIKCGAHSPPVWVQTVLSRDTDKDRPRQLKATKPNFNDKILTSSECILTQYDQCAMNVHRAAKSSSQNPSKPAPHIPKRLRRRDNYPKDHQQSLGSSNSKHLSGRDYQSLRQIEKSTPFTTDTVVLQQQSEQQQDLFLNSPQATASRHKTAANTNNMFSTKWNDLNQFELNHIHRMKEIIEKELNIDLPNKPKRLASELCTGVTLLCFSNSFMKPIQPIQICQPNSGELSSQQELLKMYQKNLRQCRELMYRFGVPKDQLFSVDLMLRSDTPAGLLSLAHAILTVYGLSDRSKQQSKSATDPVIHSTSRHQYHHHGNNQMMGQPNIHTAMKPGQSPNPTTMHSGLLSPKTNQRLNALSTWPHHLCSDV